jgi:hypothetical protein
MVVRNVNFFAVARLLVFFLPSNMESGGVSSDEPNFIQAAGVSVFISTYSTRKSVEGLEIRKPIASPSYLHRAFIANEISHGTLTAAVRNILHVHFGCLIGLRFLT